MIRITTVFLCLLLAGAAAGRYQAEASVREKRAALAAIENETQEELRTIQMLRAEVAYLENPERLAEIAEQKTDLRPTTRAQTMNAAEFAAAFDADAALPHDRTAPTQNDLILHAIALAQLQDAR